MKLNLKQFRIEPDSKVDLGKLPTKVKPLYSSKKECEKMLAENVRALSDLQQLQYASNEYALLLIFQAMDAAGKDGIIRHVMSGINPQGCQVYSFKHPSAEELDHDFMWRTTRSMPERGRIGVFNRSYYEEVLIVRVHPQILQAQNLPRESLDPNKVWKGRYQSINEFEAHMHRNGTRLMKFFLHLSKDEQRKRFLERIDDPCKNWKFSMGDIQERAQWDDYRVAYEHCLSATSTENAPWYAIPADDKKNARLIVSSLVRDTLRQLDMRYPQLDDAHLQELQSARALLSGEETANKPKKRKKRSASDTNTFSP